MLFLVQKYLNVSFWICLFWGAANVFAPAITPALRKELKSLAKRENSISVNTSSSVNTVLKNHNIDPKDSKFYDFYNCYYKLHKIFQVIPDPDFDTLELSSVTPGSGMPGSSSAAFSLGFNTPEPSSHLGEPPLELSGDSSDSNSGDNGQASGFCLLKFLTSGRDLCCRHAKAKDELLRKLQSLRDESRLLAEKVTALKKGLATRDYRRGVSFRAYFYTVCFDIFSREAGSTDFGGNFASEIAHNIREMFCDPEDYEEKSISSVYDCLDQVAKAVEEHLGNIPLHKPLSAWESTEEGLNQKGSNGTFDCFGREVKVAKDFPWDDNKGWGDENYCTVISSSADPSGGDYTKGFFSKEYRDPDVIIAELVKSISAAQDRILVVTYSLTNSEKERALIDAYSIANFDIVKAILAAKDNKPYLDAHIVIDEILINNASGNAKFLAENAASVYVLENLKPQNMRGSKLGWQPFTQNSYAIVVDDGLWFSSPDFQRVRFTTDKNAVEDAVGYYYDLFQYDNDIVMLPASMVNEFIEKIKGATKRFFFCTNTITNTDVVAAIVEAKRNTSTLDVRIFIGSSENLISLSEGPLKEVGVKIHPFVCSNVNENLALIDDTTWYGTSDFVQKDVDLETDEWFVGSCNDLFDILSDRNMKL